VLTTADLETCRAAWLVAKALEDDAMRFACRSDTTCNDDMWPAQTTLSFGPACVYHDGCVSSSFEVTTLNGDVSTPAEETYISGGAA
jgi:hypothetical protein